MKNIFNDNRGSALVWVLVICLIFGILGMAIGWVALSMNNRSVKNNNLNQAYFTARSGVDAIFSRLSGWPQDKPDEEKFYIYLQDNLIDGGQKITLENIFSKLDSMGKCDIFGEYTKGMVKLTGKASVNNDERTVTLWAKRKDKILGEAWPSQSWASPLKSVQSGANKVISVGMSSSISNKEALDNKIDVAVYTVDQDVDGILTIGKDETSEKKAIFIYVKEGKTLTLSGMNYEIPSYSNPKTTPAKGTDRWFVHPKDKYVYNTDDRYTKDDEANSTTKLNWENWNYYYGPDIFIYLDKGAELNFKEPNRNTTNKNEITPYPIYVYGETSSKVDIECNEDIVVYYADGGFAYQNTNGRQFKYEGENKTPARLPNSGYSEIGKPSDNGLFIDQWEIYQYETGGGK